MTENEQLFWNRVLVLSKERLKQTTYEFYVGDSQLVGVSKNSVTIFLTSKMKRLFWEQNLEDIVITAGFEIFEQQLHITYEFGEDNPRHFVQQETYESTPTRETYREKAEVASNQQVSIPALVNLPNTLNSKYQFSNFVKGEGNQWAVAAAIAVANTPGKIYNPLFIHGGSGLGKTHLITAIGNAIQEENPQARILYVTSEDFINDMIKHMSLNTTGRNSMETFKQKYREVDVLLIDDIQLLAKKGTMQEEFFNTFNALHDTEKQIVLTSDRNPNELNGMEERLVSRFNWGLTVEITPPNYEMRVAILTSKVRDYPYDFPQETINYIARQFDNNVRDLEGALKKISLVASVQQVHTITVDLVAGAIRSQESEHAAKKVISIKDIQKQVGQFYGVSLEQIIGTKRTQSVVFARQIAMYLARELTDNSLPKIGKEFGGRDHSTVLHAYHKIQKALTNDENLQVELATIKDNIR